MYKRGIIMGISGLFAGAFAAQCVDWKALPRATLAAGVAVAVSAVVWALSRPG